MKYASLFFLLILISCSDKECDHLLEDYHIGFRQDQSMLLYFGQNMIIDLAVETCVPQELEFFISEDNISFEKLATYTPSESPKTIEGLENGKEYYFRMVILHDEFEPITIPAIAVVPGEVNVPELIKSYIPRTIEEIILAPDEEALIYRTPTNKWYLSSLNFSDFERSIVDNVSEMKWFPDQSKLAYIKLVKQNNSLVTEGLMTYNIETQENEMLHEVESIGDYKIESLNFSSDGRFIYFMSNKDNGSDNEMDKVVYDNIWKLDLETNELEAISDFLPKDFDLQDFSEDPLNPNNFYVLGGEFSGIEDSKALDLYYFNTTLETLTLILEEEGKMYSVSANQGGNKLLLTTDKTGIKELWIWDLNSKTLEQVTDRNIYYYSDKRQSTNWVGQNKILEYVSVDNEWNFGLFDIE